MSAPVRFSGTCLIDEQRAEGHLQSEGPHAFPDWRDCTAAGGISSLMLAIIVALSYGVVAHTQLPIWQDRSQMYGATFDSRDLKGSSPE